MGDDISINIIARELIAQHGVRAAEIVEGWAAKPWTAPDTAVFWRKVLDEIRRLAPRAQP